jgi:hypothetical protein
MNPREQEISNIFESLRPETDKFQHGYAPVYASLPWQDVTSIFEIGIDKGHSLLAWTKIFPHANVYGIDTDPKVVRDDIILHPRITFERGDVKTYETDKMFDVIIDDCLHDLDTISVGWYRFRDKFKMAYIIEDVRPEIMFQVYELVAATNPELQTIFWRTSDWKGDVTFRMSDSNCFIVRR